VYASGSILVAGVVVILGRCRMPRALRLPLDISYGAYLFAYPIQQLTVTLGCGFYSGLLIATALTMVIATISALLVERPALRLARFLKQSGYKVTEAQPAQ
jgi:peptidoglycan/LPS O-acetylase OafA/YrhL